MSLTRFQRHGRTLSELDRGAVAVWKRWCSVDVGSQEKSSEAVSSDNEWRKLIEKREPDERVKYESYHSVNRRKSLLDETLAKQFELRGEEHEDVSESTERQYERLAKDISFHECSQYIDTSFISSIPPTTDIMNRLAIVLYHSKGYPERIKVFYSMMNLIEKFDLRPSRIIVHYWVLCQLDRMFIDDAVHYLFRIRGQVMPWISTLSEAILKIALKEPGHATASVDALIESYYGRHDRIPWQIRCRLVHAYGMLGQHKKMSEHFAILWSNRTTAGFVKGQQMSEESFPHNYRNGFRMVLSGLALVGDEKRYQMVKRFMDEGRLRGVSQIEIAKIESYMGKSEALHSHEAVLESGHPRSPLKLEENSRFKIHTMFMATCNLGDVDRMTKYFGLIMDASERAVPYLNIIEMYARGLIKSEPNNYKRVDAFIQCISTTHDLQYTSLQVLLVNQLADLGKYDEVVKRLSMMSYRQQRIPDVAWAAKVFAAAKSNRTDFSALTLTAFDDLIRHETARLSERAFEGVLFLLLRTGNYGDIPVLIQRMVQAKIPPSMKFLNTAAKFFVDSKAFSETVQRERCMEIFVRIWSIIDVGIPSLELVWKKHFNEELDMLQFEDVAAKYDLRETRLPDLLGYASPSSGRPDEPFHSFLDRADLRIPPVGEGDHVAIEASKDDRWETREDDHWETSVKSLDW
ncbi:hypothetical protein NDN08_003669 [Rhodosorus marinus]|uniref:Pentacotripeptide-repeat region of PRORP domain-containing protein n=1 Tax=Rhodosorus marinus TaxID=101924 RepID=A0AAV8V0U4_9RHOD|nr:hypothetical protein NDN08_003669 [Rhodosorus marinus]